MTRQPQTQANQLDKARLRRDALRMFAAGLLVGPLALAGCQQEASAPEKPSASEEKTEAASKPSRESEASATGSSESEGEEGKSGEAGATETVKLEVGDNIKYNTDQIEVAAGSTVEVTIEHTGKLPKSAMGHNFVLLKKGTKMTEFANAAMSAADSGYVPEGMKDRVIAHTKVVGGGESDTITFEAPAKGEYIFLCSFPGHASQMNGKFIVR